MYSTCARLLFFNEELGLNADYTDFCDNIRLVEETINHKAQLQGNSPHPTGFYYQQDSLKERLVIFTDKHSFFQPQISFSTPVRLARKC